MDIRKWFSPKPKEDMQIEDLENVEDVSTPEERDDQQADSPPEITDEELDRIAMERVLGRGKVADILEMAGHKTERQNVQTIPGTDVPQPYNYDQMTAEDVAVYVAKHYRDTAVSESEKRLSEMEQRIMRLNAPMLREQAIKDVAFNCSEDAKPYAEQAMKEVEKRLGKTISGGLSPQESWLIANRAEAIAASKRQAAPHLQSEQNNLPRNSNPVVVSFMEKYNKNMPGREMTYEQAAEYCKAEGIA